MPNVIPVIEIAFFDLQRLFQVRGNQMKRFTLGAATLVLGLALACSGEQPTQPVSLGGTIKGGSFGPRGVENLQVCGGGVESDPHPTAPGIFLCSLMTQQYCADSGNTDQDQDGLADYCEEQLSLAFVPELRYWSVDDVRREPYWVARRDSSGRVWLGYLLSYYYDEGSHAYGCSLPGAPDSCHGHNGDSEDLYLVVAYNASTQHWVLQYAYYSAHGDYNYKNLDPNLGYATGVTYPVHVGGYPQVWVSEGKHSMYFTQSDCNNGGVLGSDDCEDVNTYSRLEWASSWNLGSEAHPFVNGVASRNPDWYPGSGRTECYWTNKRFQGWIPDYVGGDNSDPYQPKLWRWGFSDAAGVASCVAPPPPPPPRGLTVAMDVSAPYYTAVPDGGAGSYTYKWEVCALDCDGGGGDPSPSVGGIGPDLPAHGWLYEGNQQQLYWTSRGWYVRITVTDALNGQSQAVYFVP